MVYLFTNSLNLESNPKLQVWLKEEATIIARVVADTATNGKLAEPMLGKLSLDTVDWYQ